MSAISSIQKRFVTTALLIAVILTIGSLGFSLIEGWSLSDSLFMTVISISTVGYGEVRPLSSAGRAFAMVVIISGMGALVYALSAVTAFIVEGELTDILERRNMEKKISKLAGHIVLCGLGETGRHVAEEFVKTGTSFVAAEQHQEVIDNRKNLGMFLYIYGDATQAENLIKANIRAARGMVTALGSDKDNLFVIMTAKELNPGLRVVTRSIEDDSPSKLAKVGADGIVSTNFIGGLRMASEMIRPVVVSFLDNMLRDPQRSMRIEEAHVGDSSRLAGIALKDSDIYQRTGLLVIALKKADAETYIYNPPGDVLIAPGDCLIACGTAEQFERLRQLTGG